MTTKNINDKLQGAATLWQLIFSVVSVIVVVLAFAFSLRADVNSALRETTRNATDIIEVKDELFILFSFIWGLAFNVKRLWLASHR